MVSWVLVDARAQKQLGGVGDRRHAHATLSYLCAAPTTGWRGLRILFRVAVGRNGPHWRVFPRADSCRVSLIFARGTTSRHAWPARLHTNLSPCRSHSPQLKRSALETVRDEAGEFGCEVSCHRAEREAHGATPPLEATCEQHETAEPCLSEAARISTLCAESFRPALVGRQCNVMKHHQCSKKATTE